ncbi:MAG: preprotein translocase subunit YajC [Alphaproteobacteria bacterium]|nr:preprotein translocase subunit YajC [Alphaproteobacteria bacterium]
MYYSIWLALTVAPVGAFAQAASPMGSSPFASLMPLILIFVIFYFLLIRPQQKRYKQHQAMLEALKKGDQVVTGGGIVGKVIRVEDDKAVIEIANGIEVTAVKATLQTVIVKPEPGKPAHQEKKKTEKNDNILPSKDQVANDN